MRSAQLAIDYIDAKTKHVFHVPITSFKKPNNDKAYQKLEALLDTLIDEVKDNENHPLVPLMEIIGENLEQYDNQHNKIIGHDVTDIEMVKFLMKSEDLCQKDLAHIFGCQANVSKFLNGERELSKKQILGLKNFFHISADFFLRACSKSFYQQPNKCQHNHLQTSVNFSFAIFP